MLGRRRVVRSTKPLQSSRARRAVLIALSALTVIGSITLAPAAVKAAGSNPSVPQGKKLTAPSLKPQSLPSAIKGKEIIPPKGTTTKPQRKVTLVRRPVVAPRPRLGISLADDKMAQPLIARHPFGVHLDALSDLEAQPSYVLDSMGPPVVSGLDPESGTTAGGTSVTITGSNFVSGSTTVNFGNMPATSVTFVSSIQLTAVSPTQLNGQVLVTVTTSTGTSATGTLSTYEYVPPGPYVPVTATRICDTRANTGTECSGQTLQSNSTLNVPVSGLGGVPSNASAVYVNLTDINPTAATQGSEWGMFSNRSGFRAPQEVSQYPFYGSAKDLSCDVTGDGKTDLVAVNYDAPSNTGTTWVETSSGKTFAAPVQWSGTAFNGTRAILCGDIDGDGKADLIAVNDSQVYVMYSNGSGFGPPTLISSGLFYGSVATLAGDVTGDGKTDIIAMNGTNTWVMSSTGHGFNPPAQWSGASFSGTQANLVADVTGDGKADVIAVDANQTWVMKSTGSAFGASTEWSGQSFGGTQVTLAADVTGDGKADLIAVDTYQTWVMASSGSGFGSPAQWSGWSFNGSGLVVAADIDGDGAFDLAGMDYNPPAGTPNVLEAYPYGLAVPPGSNLNVTSSTDQGNLVEVALGSQGEISVYNETGTTDISIDVVGYVTPQGYSQPTGAAAYWKFDDNTGTTAADATGNGHTATFSGNTPYWTAGKINSGADFNGADGAATGNIDISNGAQASLSFWWDYGATFPSSAQTIAEESTRYGSNNAFRIAINGSVSGKIEIAVHGSGSNIVEYSPPGTGWHHYTAVMDRAQSGALGALFYIDGVAQGPSSVVSTSVVGGNFSNLPLFIGASSGVVTPLTGSIDEAGIWGRALSASEAMELYDFGSGLQYPFSGYSSTAGLMNLISPEARICDTRNNGNSTPCVDHNAIGSGATFTMQATGQGGIPSSGVQSVVIDVTAVPATSGGGYFIIYPAGARAPAVGFLNYGAADWVSERVIVPVGTNGQVTFSNNGPGTVNIVVDANGWTSDGSSQTQTGQNLNTQALDRACDTRLGSGYPCAGQNIANNGTQTFTLAGLAGIPSTGVSQVAINVTMITPGSTAPGRVVVWPYGSSMPGTTDIVTSGNTISNFDMVVGLGSGKINIYSDYSAAVAIDVEGYYHHRGTDADDHQEHGEHAGQQRQPLRQGRGRSVAGGGEQPALQC